MGQRMGQVRQFVKSWLIGFRAELEMKSAIRAMNGVYSKEREKRNYERENRQYLVLIAIPVIQTKPLNPLKGTFGTRKFLIKKDKLYWVNRGNFRAVKKAGWLPYTMFLNELREKAFYYTDESRSYVEEQKVKEKAIEKYRSYLLECRGTNGTCETNGANKIKN